jgi:hypothetical protein
MSMESPQNLIESIGLAPEHAGSYSDLSNIFKSIDNVSANDINAVIFFFHFFFYLNN